MQYAIRNIQCATSDTRVHILKQYYTAISHYPVVSVWFTLKIEHLKNIGAICLLQHSFCVACHMTCSDITVYDIALHQCMNPYCYSVVSQNNIFLRCICMLHSCKILLRHVSNNITDSYTNATFHLISQYHCNSYHMLHGMNVAQGVLHQYSYHFRWIFWRVLGCFMDIAERYCFSIYTPVSLVAHCIFCIAYRILH